MAMVFLAGVAALAVGVERSAGFVGGARSSPELQGC